MSTKQGNPKRGLYIAFEGIDGSGKSTQIEILKENIYNNIPSLQVRTTREPSDGPIGRMIRLKYLSSRRVTDPQTLKLLYAADRIDNITTKDGVIDLLDSGKTVISDRCFLSSCAYDTYNIILNEWENPEIQSILSAKGHTNHYISSKLHSEVIRVLDINSKSLDLCTPDMIFYIDVPADIAMTRVDTRGKHKDMYEDRIKLSAIREAYKLAIDVVKGHKSDIKIFTIDGTENEDDIANSIMTYVEYELRVRNLI